MTNSDRAYVAYCALMKHVEETGSEGEEGEVQVTDLLTNLRHLCSIMEVDFDESLAISLSRFREENAIFCKEPTI